MENWREKKVEEANNDNHNKRAKSDTNEYNHYCLHHDDVFTARFSASLVSSAMRNK